MTERPMQNRSHEIEKARRYLARCENQVTAAMHEDHATFLAASAAVRQAQIRLAILEKNQ